MENVGTFFANLFGFMGSIWSFIFAFYVIAQIRKHMLRGRSIGGALLAEAGTWVGGAFIATIAFWAVFAIATPGLENQAEDYSGQSKAGEVFYDCVQSGFDCFPKDGQTTTQQQSYFPGDDTQQNYQPAQPQIVPSDQSAPPPADGPQPQQPAQSVAPSVPTYSGPPNPGLFLTNQQVATCTAIQLLTVLPGLSGDAIQSPAKGYLPAGSKWTISSPNWWNHTMVGADKETWILRSNDWPDFSYEITGDLARALGGKINLIQNRKSVTVTGTGQLPQACWPQNLNPIP